jgi:hypothetical protein
MKRFFFLASFAVLTGTVSWADTPTPTPGSPSPTTNTQPPNGGPVHPCKQLEQACVDAGFGQGEAAKGMGLFKNCMHPIMQGEAVKGVTVDPKTVADCKARMAQMQGHPQVGNSVPASPGNSVTPQNH